MNSDLTKYTDLIRAFLGGGMSAETFESEYLDLFKADPNLWSEPIFDVLDRLFFAVDAFSPDPALRGDDGLDEGGLRAEAERALAQLTGGSVG